MIWLALLAQEKQGGGEGPGGLLGGPLPLFIGMAVLFYFLLLRPARRQEKDRQTMIDALRKNDEVVTNAGIIGTVVNIKKDRDEVTLESGGSRMRVLKSSIARVVSRSGEEDDDEEKKPDGETPDERVQKKD